MVRRKSTFWCTCFQNPRFIFSECWSFRNRFAWREMRSNLWVCKRTSPILSDSDLPKLPTDVLMKTRTEEYYGVFSSHKGNTYEWEANTQWKRRGSGWTLQWSNMTSLINELPSEEPICFLIRGDRCGRGVKHTDPEGTKVY